MNKLTPGKIRGLRQLADERGILTVCAFDHRESLQKALNEKNPESVSYRDMVEFKLDLCRAVGGSASAVLLDPLYGAAQAIASGVLPGKTGLLVSLEKTGYTGESTARVTELLPGWGVEKIKRLGASAVKLLIYFRPDLEEVAGKQLELVERVAGQCIEYDLPLLVESVTYPTEEEKNSAGMFSERKPQLVLEAARQLTTLPIDILKSEFPADIDYETDRARMENYCRELSKASRLPWVLLSAGADFKRFKTEVEMACGNGASGFMAGRALWQEAAHIASRETRMEFFRNTTVSRLEELKQIADGTATPWYAGFGSRDGSFPEPAEGWYGTY